jgi:L,D-transpeptidase YbiS
MKIALKIIIPAVVLLAAVYGTVKIIRARHREAGIQLVALPDNQKLAQKEIARLRLTLSKLRPKGRYIVINTHANILSLRNEDSVIFKGNCSTGSGGELIDSTTGRHWIFDTPRGIFKVNSKLTQPWWRKPDWAFIEENEKIPKNESDRMDPEMLGEFALGFGDGYFIHGTIYERLLGVAVTHGCVRLGSDDLKLLYSKVNIGTPVYIF